jgi:signal transduction histidine kinase
MPDPGAPAGPRDAAWQLLEGPIDLPMLVLDPEGRVVHANRYARETLGETGEESCLRDLLVDFIHAPSLQAMFEAEGPCLLTFRTRRRVPLSFHVAFRRAGDRVVAIGTRTAAEEERLQDRLIALNQDLGRLARALEKANAELKRLGRLKDLFLGMAAHDLRKPIGAVLNFAEILESEAGPALEADHVRFLGIIASSARSMRRLVDDFLDVARIESGRLELEEAPTSMEDVLRRTTDAIGPAATRKGVAISVAVAPDVGPVRMDGPKIEQVLSNLVSNAVEHSVPGSPVDVRVRRLPACVEVAVRDRGTGIAPGDRDRLFLPFGRGRSRKTGGEPSTGMGLLIARKIVEAHGGEISLASEVGAGTEVRFTLPDAPRMPGGES